MFLENTVNKGCNNHVWDYMTWKLHYRQLHEFLSVVKCWVLCTKTNQVTRSCFVLNTIDTSQNGRCENL